MVMLAELQENHCISFEVETNEANLSYYKFSQIDSDSVHPELASERQPDFAHHHEHFIYVVFIFCSARKISESPNR